MTVGEIVKQLDKWAHPSWAESYDNVGLLVGSREREVKSVLVTLDVTETIVKEAIEQNCQMIVAHHPLIFKGLKKLTGSHWVERTAIKAIENKIAIYATHTNLDNAIWGVNARLGQVLGLKELEILRPFTKRLEKCVTYVPADHLDQVRSAMFRAGAGHIGNYDECSFLLKGTGTFRPTGNANPFTGKLGFRSEEEEVRLEVLMRDSDAQVVLSALRSAHPYEEVPYERYSIENEDQERGAGMIGEFEREMNVHEFTHHLKEKLQLKVLRHTSSSRKKIKRVAYCGGSGSFLLQDALRANADAYLTGDVKYHEFFEADERLMFCDIGHYESEQYTRQLIVDKLLSFATFAVRLSEISTNPILYA
jgi:dinuclear metal center YbgI/SA1388 family protein